MQWEATATAAELRRRKEEGYGGEASIAMTAYALEQRRKRKEEEARQAAEAQEKSARRNAAEALQRIQNWLIGQHIQKQQEEAARQAQQRAMDAKIARMEEAEGAAQTAKPQRAEQAYQAYLAGERNAEAIAADYQSRKAIQDFRAGERASYEPAAQPKSLWQRAGDWIADKVDDAVDAFSGLYDSLVVRHLKFVEQESGHISVRAETPPGTRLKYRAAVAKEGFDFAGTRYNPETIAARTAGGLLKSAVSIKSLGLAGVTSLVSNLWTFGTNPAEGKTFLDRTLKNREFWVSTGVDAVVSVAVGVAAAAVVGALVTATTPLWLAVGATAAVSVVIGLGVDAVGIPEWLKTQTNILFGGCKP